MIKSLKISVPRPVVEFGVTILLAMMLARQFSGSPLNITLGSLALVVAVPVLLKKPEYALFFLTIIFPFRDVHIVSIIHLKRLCIWGLLAYTMLRQLENRQRLISRSLFHFSLMIMGFLTMLGLSLIKTASELYSTYEITPALLKTTILSDALVIFEQILIVYIMYYLFTTVLPITRLLDVLFAVSALVSILAIWQYLLGGPPAPVRFLFDPEYVFYGRATSVFSNPNGLGAFTAQMLVLACVSFLWSEMTRWKRLLFVLPVVLVTGSALILSFSRGAILQLLFGLGVAGIVYYVKICNRKLNWKIVSLVIIGLTIMASIVLLYDVFLRARLKAYTYNEYQAAVNWLESTSDFRRKHAAVSALQTFLQHPLLGIGYNLFTVKGAISLEHFGLPVHNQYLKILAEMGIFGFLSFLAALGMVYKAALRTWTPPPDRRMSPDKQLLMCIFLAAFSTLAFGLLFGDALALISTAGYLWLYAGAIFILDCRHHNVQNVKRER